MSDRVVQACAACFDAHKDDCSAFARAVADRLGVPLTGVADEMVETIRGTDGGWRPLREGAAAAASASSGMLVIGGLKGSEQTHPGVHGHVVVVIAGPLNRGKYPTAYWGSLGGEPGEAQTINWAWTASDRDHVTYAAFQLAEDAVEPASSPETVIDPGEMALPFLVAAIRAAAPEADAERWAKVMEPHLLASDLTTPRRVAAFLGQAVAEAGADFAELSENTRYTHAERLFAVFPSRFPSIAVAAQYVGDERRIACRAYAGKLGNGDEASGDGWRYRGAGLLQLTGRDTFQLFARTLEAPIAQVADWIRTPNGAIASACWYWRTHRLNPLADAWDLASVTLAVNGHAMLAHAQRVASASAALRAAGGT